MLVHFGGSGYWKLAVLVSSLGAASQDQAMTTLQSLFLSRFDADCQIVACDYMVTINVSMPTSIFPNKLLIDGALEGRLLFLVRSH